MKYIILTITVLFPVWILAQDCGTTPQEGFITTDPENPNNPECPDKINTFDWRQEYWNTPTYSGTADPDVPLSDREVWSPFFNTDNTAIKEIYNTINFNGKDFEVEDGWELIRDGISQQQGGAIEISYIWYFIINIRQHFEYLVHMIELNQNMIL